MKTTLLFLSVLKFVHGYSPSVRIEEGNLIGKEYTLANGKIINAFLGIPYAAPPVASYRFKEPQRKTPWIDAWNATYYRSACLQIKHVPEIIYKIEGSEDCLYLNVFAPKLNKTCNLLNVMVVIHGGGFSYGSGNLLPDRLLENNDIVFVTMNYRLGIFGFLSTNDYESPGNFGMKDQVEVLKWVKQNIVSFGGNPAKVTIFGHSSGSSCVHYHMISPLTDGLFQKAISLSGTIDHPWALPRDTTQKSFRLAALVKCPTHSTKDMLQCLRQKSSLELIQAAKNFMIWRYVPTSPFNIVIEPPSINAFIYRHPMELLEKGKVKDVPWMTTMVKDEGITIPSEFMHSDVYLKELNDGWNQIAPNLLHYNHSVPENEKDRVSSAIKRFYFGEKPVCNKTITELGQCLGDRYFTNGIIEGSSLHNLVVKTPIYCYKFNYRTERSFTNFMTRNSIHYGVGHGDDLLLIMKGFANDNITTISDLEVSKLLISVIIDFMNSGTPNKVLPFWEPITKKPNIDLNCLIINSSTELKMGNIPYNTSSRQFWKTILPWEQRTVKKNHSHRCFVTKLLFICTILVVIMYL